MSWKELKSASRKCAFYISDIVFFTVLQDVFLWFICLMKLKALESYKGQHQRADILISFVESFLMMIQRSGDQLWGCFMKVKGVKYKQRARGKNRVLPMCVDVSQLTFSIHFTFTIELVISFVSPVNKSIMAFVEYIQFLKRMLRICKKI